MKLGSRIIARIVPEAMFPESPDQLRHARLVALFALLIAALVVPLSLVQAFFGSPKVMAVVLAGLAALGLIPLLRWTRSVVLTANVLVGLFAAALTAVAVIRGGYGVPIVTAFVVIPMLAVTLAGRASGKVWLVLTLLILCGVGVLQRFGALPQAAPLADPVATNWPGTLLFVASTYVLMAVTVHLRMRAMQDQQAAEEQLWESERRRLASETEAQLLRSSRLAELGTLAAGVAHEINNPLSYIHNNLEYLQRLGAKVGPEETAQIYDEIRIGADRIARIVRDIGTFSRVDAEEAAEPLDLREALESSLNLLQNQFRHRATLRRDYEEVPLVSGSPSRLAQVFINVLTNALQALPEGTVDKNQITVRVRAGSAGEPTVRVEIEDNGCGIPPEVKSRAFEPFYTTKPVGVGTGLGLSICYGIVSKLNGQIQLDSVEGRGTTVTIELPASTAELQAPEPVAAAPVQDGRAVKILIIDDDHIVAGTIARMLRHHEVTVVTRGSEALTRLDRGASYDVLLCDLMMPDLTGMELYRQLERTHRELTGRVIFVTGGAFTSQAQDFLQRTSNLCLEKPLDFDRLERAIQAMVN